MIKDFIDTIMACPIFDGIEKDNLLHFLCCCGAHQETYSDGERILPDVRRSVICIPLVGKVNVHTQDGNSIIQTLDPLRPFSPISPIGLPYFLTAKGDTVILVLDGARSFVPCDNCKFHALIVQRLFNLVKNGMLLPDNQKTT